MEVPYNKAKNENPKGLYAAYINKAGKIERIKGSKYDSKTGMLTVNIKKTVKFVILYKAPKTKKNK